MAQTGQVGGRQSLDNNRTATHSAPPAVQQAPEADRVANASTRSGSPNTNRIGSPDRVPEIGKVVSASGMSTYRGKSDTNRNSRRGPN